MNFRLWHAVVFVAAFVVFAVARAPASFFLPAQPGGFAYERAVGTIWRARFEGARLAGYDAGEIAWRLSLRGLLQGKAVADVALSGGAIQGQAQLLANWHGDKRIVVPRLDIVGAALGPFAAAEGRTEVRDLDIFFDDGRCAAAAGALTSDLLAAGGRALGWEAPQLNGGAACVGEDAVVALAGEQNGEEAHAMLTLRGNGDGEWRVRLRTAKPEAQAALAAAQFTPEAEGGALARQGDMRWTPF